MGAVQKMDVSVNIAQDFNDTQKKQGRDNIGATRVVYIDTTANYSDIQSILNAGDLPVLKVDSCFLSLVAQSDLLSVFTGTINGKVVVYTLLGSTWTSSEKPLRSEWVSFTPDTLQTTEAKELFAIGNVEFGYYYDSGSAFRLAMRSTSGTRYVYLADHHGYGGGYALTTNWVAISIYGFSSSCQLEHLKGYDTTGNTNLDFDVYYANGVSPFVPVAQYRVNL